MAKTKFKQYILPDYYDTSVELIVGRLTLLYGQIDRILIQAIRAKSNPQINIEETIAIARDGRGKTLGDWIKWFENGEPQKLGIDEKYCLAVAKRLSEIRTTRDCLIHDTLMLDENNKRVKVFCACIASAIPQQVYLLVITVMISEMPRPA